MRSKPSGAVRPPPGAGWDVDYSQNPVRVKIYMFHPNAGASQKGVDSKRPGAVKPERGRKGGLWGQH